MKRKIILTIFFLLSFSLFFSFRAKADEVYLEVTFDGVTKDYNEEAYNNLNYGELFNFSSPSKPVNIKLFKNINGNFIIENGNYVIFDLNGLALIGESSDYVFRVKEGAKLEVKSEIAGAKIKNRYNSDSNEIKNIIYNLGEFNSNNISFEMAYNANLVTLSEIINNKNIMKLENSNILNSSNYKAIINTAKLDLINTAIKENKMGVDNYGDLTLVGTTNILNNIDGNLILNANKKVEFDSFSGNVSYAAKYNGCLTNNFEQMNGTFISDDKEAYQANGELYYYTNPFEVTVYKNDGTTDLIKTSIEFGNDEFKNDIIFSRLGYYLQGYALDEVGTTFVVDSFGIPFVSVNGYTDSLGNWIYNDNISLYAIWSESGYSVLIHNVDEIINKTVTFSDNKIVGLELERDGYIFDGLYYEEELINKICNDDFTFIASTSYTDNLGKWNYIGSVNLYAKWIPLTYELTVSYDDNIDKYNISYDSTKIDSFTSYNKYGFSFTGLADENDVLVFNSEGKLIKDVEGFSDSNGRWIRKENANLHPIFSAKRYKISINDYEDFYYIEMGYDSIYGFKKLEKTNYTFKGLEYNGSLLVDENGKLVESVTNITTDDGKWDYDGNITADALFERTKVVINIDFNNGDNLVINTYSGEVLANLLDIPQKEGYIFIGIYDELGLEYFDNTASSTELEVTSDLSLFARWGVTYKGVIYDKKLVDSNIESSGNYYLDNDLTLNSLIIEENTNINLYLNGHKLIGNNDKLIELKDNSSLNIIKGIINKGLIYSSGNLSLKELIINEAVAQNSLIYSLGQLDINDVEIVGNQVNKVLDIRGVGNNLITKLNVVNNKFNNGIYNLETLVISGSKFNYNEVLEALIINKESLTIDNAEFNNNSSNESLTMAIISNENRFIGSNIKILKNEFINSNYLIYNYDNFTATGIEISDNKILDSAIYNTSFMSLKLTTIKNNIVGIYNKLDAHLHLENSELNNTNSDIINLGIVVLANKAIVSKKLTIYSENSITIDGIDSASNVIVDVNNNDKEYYKILLIPESNLVTLTDVFKSFDDGYRLFIEDDILYLLDVSLEKKYNITYNLALDGYEVLGFNSTYLSSLEEIIIELPDEYNDGIHGKKDIVRIADDAFKNVGVVGGINLPINLKKIGKDAFKNNNIKSIDLPKLNGESVYEDLTPFDDNVIIVAYNASDYYYLKGIEESSYLTYQIKVLLDSNGGTLEENEIIKLYGFDYHYVNKDGYWQFDEDYKLQEAYFEDYRFKNYNSKILGDGQALTGVVLYDKYYAIYDRIMTNLVVSVVNDTIKLDINDTLTSSKWKNMLKVEIEYQDKKNRTETDEYIINGNIDAGYNNFEFVLVLDESIKGSIKLQVIDDNVTKIEINKNPSKMTYEAFDELDTTGLEIRVYRGENVTIASNVEVVYQSGNSLVNRGNLEDEVTIRYSLCETKLKVTVNKKKYSIPDNLFINKIVEYNGSEQSILINGDLPEGIIVKYQNNKLKDVGSIEATASFEIADKLNYEEINSVKATLTITPKEIVIIWSDEVFIYDKTAKTVTATASNLIEGDSCNITIKLSVGSNNIDAGKFTYSAYELSNPNYKLPSNKISPEYEIKKAKAMVAWSNLEVTYNGDILYPTVQIFDLIGNDECEAVVEGFKNAGRYVSKITSLTNLNYYVPIMENDFVINKASLDDTNISFLNATIVFDGNEHELLIKGEIPEDISVTYENNKLTNVGVVTAKAKFVVENDNYEDFEDLEAKLTITTLYVDKPYISTTEYVYNGSLQKLMILQSNWYEAANDVQINAGKYDVTISLKDKNNTNWADGSIEDLTYEFIIKKAKYNISTFNFMDTSFEYDGQEHKLEISGTLPTGLTVEYENNTITEVGSKVAKAIFTNNNPNYEDISDMTAIISVLEPLSKQEFINIDGNIKIVLKDQNDVIYLLITANIEQKDLANIIPSKYTTKEAYDIYLQNGEEIVKEGNFEIRITKPSGLDNFIIIEIDENNNYREINYELEGNEVIISTSKLAKYAFVTKINYNYRIDIISCFLVVIMCATSACFIVILRRKKLFK